MKRRAFITNTIFYITTTSFSKISYANLSPCLLPHFEAGTYYLYFDIQNNTYYLDVLNNTITKVSNDNSIVWKIGEEQNLFNQLGSIALDENNRLFALDHGADEVKVFNIDGKYLYKFGKTGTDEHSLLNPKGSLLIKNNNIYVCDEGNNRINIFNLEGKHESILNTNDYNFLPIDIASDSNNFIYLLDKQCAKIHVYNEKLKKIKTFGGYGKKEGKFICPNAIAIDNYNNIYISDSANGNINIFSKDFGFKKRFQLFYPKKIIATPLHMSFDLKQTLYFSAIPDLGNYSFN